MCFLRELMIIFHPLEGWRFYLDKSRFIEAVMTDLLKAFKRLDLLIANLTAYGSDNYKIHYVYSY